YLQLAHDAAAAGAEERAAALEVLVARLARTDPEAGDGAAYVAIAGGALVEYGAPAHDLGDALLAKMPGVLGAARRFADACLAALGEPHDGESELAEEEIVAHVDDRPLSSAVFHEKAAAD